MSLGRCSDETKVRVPVCDVFRDLFTRSSMWMNDQSGSIVEFQLEIWQTRIQHSTVNMLVRLLKNVQNDPLIPDCSIKERVPMGMLFDIIR